MSNLEVEVYYEGVYFDVSGEFIPPTPGIPYNNAGDPGDPPQDGYFIVDDILIDEQSVKGLLKDNVVEKLTQLAYEEACENM